jgi:hypothetical protein
MTLSWLARLLRLAIALSLVAAAATAHADPAQIVDASTLKGRVMCGYQGWFRCPGDAANEGWVHWSRDANRLTPQTVTIEMWPDVSEYADLELYPAGAFHDADGRAARLFSSDNPATVDRHFAWMRDYGIDGAWLQHFIVDLPGGATQQHFASRSRVLRHVTSAAEKTGRAWAISYDIAGAREDQIFDLVTSDWKRLVKADAVRGDRYLRHLGRPVVQIWGFYKNDVQYAMTPAVANELIEFFAADGPHAAFLVGGGDWDWRRNADPAWQALYRRLPAYAPWNVGNYSTDKLGVRHATMDHWAEDKRQCDERGAMWMPVVYPGFSWDNLRREPPGTSTVARRGGAFYWEQFFELARLKPDAIYVAMFDEVDEGTAIFKVTNTPPVEARFLTYESLPADWYLRLTGQGARMLRGQIPLSASIPFKP